MRCKHENKVAKTFEGFLFMFLLVCNEILRNAHLRMSNYLQNLEVTISIIFIHICTHLFYLLNMEHFFIKQQQAL